MLILAPLLPQNQTMHSNLIWLLRPLAGQQNHLNIFFSFKQEFSINIVPHLLAPWPSLGTPLARWWWGWWPPATLSPTWLYCDSHPATQSAGPQSSPGGDIVYILVSIKITQKNNSSGGGGSLKVRGNHASFRKSGVCDIFLSYCDWRVPVQIPGPGGEFE